MNCVGFHISSLWLWVLRALIITKKKEINSYGLQSLWCSKELALFWLARIDITNNYHYLIIIFKWIPKVCRIVIMKNIVIGLSLVCYGGTYLYTLSFTYHFHRPQPCPLHLSPRCSPLYHSLCSPVSRLMTHLLIQLLAL